MDGKLSWERPMARGVRQGAKQFRGKIIIACLKKYFGNNRCWLPDGKKILGEK
jgi:hypothetical protein